MKASWSLGHNKPSSLTSNDAMTVSVCPALMQCSTVVRAMGTGAGPLLDGAPTSRLNDPIWILPEGGSVGQQRDDSVAAKSPWNPAMGEDMGARWEYTCSYLHKRQRIRGEGHRARR